MANIPVFNFRNGITLTSTAVFLDVPVYGVRCLAWSQRINKSISAVLQVKQHLQQWRRGQVIDERLIPPFYSFSRIQVVLLFPACLCTFCKKKQEYFDASWV